MNREDFRREILSLDVYDTHTHLIGKTLAAQDFWDIGHYFWFLEELCAAGYPHKAMAGYPQNAKDISEEQQIEAFVKAFHATRNTSMNWVVCQIFDTLYSIQITDEASVWAAGEAVRATAKRIDWPAEVAARACSKRMVVNVAEDADFHDLPGVSVLVPRIEGPIDKWQNAIMSAPDQRDAAEHVVSDIDKTLGGFKQQGCPGIMTALGRMGLRTHGAPDELKVSGNSNDEVLVFLLRKIAAAAEANGLFVQLFLGVEGDWNKMGYASANDPDRILNLHGLFEDSGCQFELVLGSEINTLDAVQAARAFKNVSVGGQWWFNFRASTYRDSMQKRLEALPPEKSSVVVSDGRCIEWCYGKILLIKRLLADFLFDQIQLGWLDREEALRVAREWLHDSAAARYGERS
ncbi:MAG: glucuronate isomerase [Armatimonadota bacterium]|nr:glucuronate isomerase [Armatimonadota bacterium]